MPEVQEAGDGDGGEGVGAGLAWGVLCLYGKFHSLFPPNCGMCSRLIEFFPGMQWQLWRRKILPSWRFSGSGLREVRGAEAQGVMDVNEKVPDLELVG